MSPEVINGLLVLLVGLLAGGVVGTLLANLVIRMVQPRDFWTGMLIAVPFNYGGPFVGLLVAAATLAH